jgi:hypothetical protein
MRANQFASDDQPDFTLSVAIIQANHGHAKDLKSVVDSSYKLLSSQKAETGKDNGVPTRGKEAVKRDIDAQKALSEAHWKSIEALNRAFREGQTKLRVLADSLCVPVDKSRLEVTLSIDTAFGFPKDAPPKRALGKTLVGFKAEPVSVATFEVNLGVMLTVLPSEKRKFSLSNNLIVSEVDREPDFSVGSFIMARTKQVDWLWGTIGVGTRLSKDVVSDLFFGFATKVGASITGNGPQMTLGAGLALSKVPVSLKNGVVGEVLPASVKNLDDITERNFRPALGFMFTLTGLDLGSKAPTAK